MLTSAVSVAQVGESPNVSQSHGIADAGHEEIQASTPVAPLGLIATVLGQAIRFIAFLRSLSGKGIDVTIDP